MAGGSGIVLIMGGRAGDSGHRCSQEPHGGGLTGRAQEEVAVVSCLISENNSPFELLGWEVEDFFLQSFFLTG